MTKNKIQFAVIREDPNQEASCLIGTEKILLIASGGCTAFHLQCMYNDLDITIIDANKNQLELTEKKRQLLNAEIINPTEWTIGSDVNTSLNACGNFESLFRQFRLFLEEFIISHKQMREILFNKADTNQLLQNPYWKVAFDLFFSDSILNTMFGPEATQHSNGYPSYFKNVIEEGLNNPKRASNYWLHHILLGYYDHSCTPLYLQKPIFHKPFELINAKIQDIKDFSEYNFIGLSNVFDWLDTESTRYIIETLKATTKKHCKILLRQLNNSLHYDFGEDFNEFILDQDNSMFYNRITLYEKK